MNMHKKIDEFFKEGGVLHKKMPRYEFREGQIKMCHDVADILLNGGVLLVEAGTGIGKTMAYLIPAILINEKIIISTGTKTLQEQIYFKDIEFLKNVGMNISACYMKGRNNYICLKKINEIGYGDLLPLGEELKYWDSIKEWLSWTEKGDKSELSSIPENLSLWNDICCDTEGCLGKRCNFYNDCFLYRMRKKAEESQLVIVNHHLFFADLNLKTTMGAELIPDFEKAIFDEAHLLEDAALNYFSVLVAPWQLFLISRDIERRLYKLEGKERTLRKDLIISQIGKVLILNQSFFDSFERKEENKFSLNNKILDRDKLDKAKGLMDEVYELIKRIESLSNIEEEWVFLKNKLMKFNKDLEFILERGDKDYVYWGELSEKASVMLYATPIEISGILREKLWDNIQAAVLTSATLTARRDFNFIKEKLGINSSKDVIYDSPFDYKKQAILYIPRKFPEPSDENFIDAISEMICKIIDISKGRTFVLFTSIQNMKKTYEKIKDKISYPLYLQGEKPKRRLIEEFKEKGNAVLLATSSFWQGVDIIGEALSCVIIDKLPFSVPTDPIIEARLKRIREKGRNPFYSYQLPEAVLNLRQGLGRLIRSKEDTGILALLDNRVYERDYGRFILISLKEMEITNSLKDLERIMNYEL